jgi:hypothetical protein
MVKKVRPPDRIRLRRNPKKGRYERETVASNLDRGLVAHVAADGETMSAGRARSVALHSRVWQAFPPVDVSAGALTGAAATVSVLIALHRMKGMDMGVATTLGSFSFFLVAWLSMMAAMMLPGALPAVVRNARERRRIAGAMLFAASYLAVWLLVGLLVYAVYEPHSTTVAATLTIVVSVQKLLPPRPLLDVPLAFAILGLGVLILVTPSTIPGLTPSMRGRVADSLLRPASTIATLEQQAIRARRNRPAGELEGAVVSRPL